MIAALPQQPAALPDDDAGAPDPITFGDSPHAYVGRLGLTPDSPGAKLVMLAILAVRHGMWDQAISALEQASRFHPDNTDILFELGFLHQHRRSHDAALATYNQIVALRPRWANVYANLGSLLISMGRLELAIQASRIGIALDPELPGLYINLASALRSDNRFDEAWQVYKDLLDRHPKHAAGLTDSLHLRQHLNDWDGIAAHRELVRTHTYRVDARVPPFSVLTAIDDPTEQKLAARGWNLRMRCEAPLAPLGPRPAAARDRRIRVGYLSNDFYNHATSLLLIELLELRDRERFEVIGYSTDNLDDGTLIRHRIIAAFDVCYDLKSVSDEEAARKIRDDDIDILIDLKGYTQGARTEIVARRPAPVQVNFLGFPGSMGAPFINYIIADRHVVPPGHDGEFDEKVVRLPDCYQPNDRKRRTWPEPYTRAGCGLPPDSFVFCSFNAPYKITPELFDLWMRILHRVPGAVLWMLEGVPTSTANLRREAAKRGIAPERLVFAPKMVTEKHLARMRLGDLCLDTFPVTGHTTASDALWVGLPVLACSGGSFVSRVAGSLLHAVGLPDMVAADLDAYEEMAVALARDPARLAAIRARLEANRLTSPLFDSVRYTRHYEAALARMIANLDSGAPPAAFDVPFDG